MRHLYAWLIELWKLIEGRRLYPIVVQCPVCQQKVRLHVNNAGRRHVYGHAVSLYQGAQFGRHFVGSARCLGSGRIKQFDPRPSEHQHFKLPDSLTKF
jgi:hypothetical protein